MRTAQLDRRALHQALDARRKAEGLTWARVAIEAGVVPCTLSRLNVGYGSPSADSLVRLLAWLGTSDVAPFVTPGR